MHDQRTMIERRVRRVLDERIRPAQTVTLQPVTVTAWTAPGEPVPPAQAMAEAAYEPMAVGTAWGAPWSTTWMRLRTVVPEEHRGEHLEVHVDLGWSDGPGFSAEGLVFAVDGQVVKGLHPRNDWIPIWLDGDGVFEMFIEAAANPELSFFHPTPLGERHSAGKAPIYRLRRADLVRVHEPVRALVADVVALDGLARTLPDDSTRAWQVLRALDRALDQVDLADIPGTVERARAVLAPVLAAPAAASAHRITAVGHAHIDSAWLWPVRETRRKVARTVANVLRLVDDAAAQGADGGPAAPLVFAFPAAAHYSWLEADHPGLFARLTAAVAAGQVVPVGGMWVEPDANLPSGESLCRQLTMGTRYLRERFGEAGRCAEVWLPDSFGYSGALPQLAVLAGARAFLTQKLSWNQVDRFPHHSFWWEGIDGTRIYTHFPPVDTYNSDLSAGQLARAAGNFADKGRANRSLVPFGYGDGGGGPTREMLEQAARVADLDGSPRVEIGRPAEFFDAALAEHEDPPVWVGELYLQGHRGTFTSQARTKEGNRRCERLLREAELWCATAAVRGLLDYPYAALEEIWRQVLLGQFHDILPGSSIAWVHREVEQVHDEAAARLQTLIDAALRALAARPPTPVPSGVAGPGADPVPMARFQAAPWVAEGLAMGAVADRGHPATAVTVIATGGQAFLDNGRLRVTVDARGLVTSILDLAADRELIPPGQVGNLLALHQDFPNAWDAWDVDLSYRNTVVEITDLDELSAEPTPAGGAVIRVARSFGADPANPSRVVQTLMLQPRSAELSITVEVDWHERDRFLKLAWPVDLHTDQARYETQFGHVVRPTHDNTTWDRYRFEVPAHRWVHVGETGYGVAIANERTYGWDITRSARDGGGTFSTVRASLLRGAQFPDPGADAGRHTFGFVLAVGAGVADAIKLGYALAHPPRLVPGAPVDPLVRVAGPVVVETVKLADDRSGDLILRLYEPLGGQARAKLLTSFDTTAVEVTDLHEAPVGEGVESPVQGVGVRAVSVRLKPFQVVTLRVRTGDS